MGNSKDNPIDLNGHKQFKSSFSTFSVEFEHTSSRNSLLNDENHRCFSHVNCKAILFYIAIVFLWGVLSIPTIVYFTLPIGSLNEVSKSIWAPLQGFVQVYHDITSSEVGGRFAWKFNEGVHTISVCQYQMCACLLCVFLHNKNCMLIFNVSLREHVTTQKYKVYRIVCARHIKMVSWHTVCHYSCFTSLSI